MYIYLTMTVVLSDIHTRMYKTVIAQEPKLCLICQINFFKPFVFTLTCVCSYSLYICLHAHVTKTLVVSTASSISV